MHVPSVIERKRDGAELTAEEIHALVRGFTRGDIPDYQMSAFAMAVYFRGMTAAETAVLTRAMMESGSVLRHPADAPRIIDKHSTGGVGDKVSLVLAPLLACDDVRVPMISGRALGITGGTLDKLESIPGFDVNLDEATAMDQLARIGVFMIGQTADICPADKKLYALRDVTATVPSPPLIIASIMSKKLAESLDALVLDVKFGSGAFMKTRTDAEALAHGLTEIGGEMGVAMSYRLTPMDEPLGRAVGNALEVAEAVDALQGRGPDDLVQLTLDLASRVAVAPPEQLDRWLANGDAWKKFTQLVEAQHGDATALDRLLQMHRAPVRHEIKAPVDGTVSGVNAERIARACLSLGAGRHKADDRVDFAIGCSGLVKTGERVERGATLFTIHARTESALSGVLQLLETAVALNPC